MREIEIVLPKTTYVAGEVIRGYALVRCDEEFECNRIIITLEGKGETKIHRGSGDSSTTYHDVERFIHRKVTLYPGGIVYSGETRFQFSFELSMELPPSYRCQYGGITYELYAKIEVSWALDPKDKKRIMIVMPYQKQPGLAKSASHMKEGMPILEVSTEDTSFCIGEQIPIRVRVSNQVNIRGVRIELVHHEKIRAERAREHLKRTLEKMFIDKDNIPFDMWFDVNLQLANTTPPSFRTKLITSYLVLKVTLDIPWRFDKSVEIRIIAGWCVEPHIEDDNFGDF